MRELQTTKKGKEECGLKIQGGFKRPLDDRPLISVITVTRNAGESIEETIRSIVNQSYENIEYVIVDGGSEDETLDIIQSYESSIDYWVSETDDGLYDAMNKGLRLANGDWINFMAMMEMCEFSRALGIIRADEKISECF